MDTSGEKFQTDYNCFCQLEEKSNEQLFQHVRKFLEKNNHISYDEAIATLKLFIILTYQIKYDRENAELN